MSKRATYHNGKIATTKHNDRAFDLDKAEHIDQEKTPLNWYWSWNGMSFAQAEKTFYERFKDTLEARNQAYEEQGHAERCKNITQYRTGQKTCPEETLFYLGGVTDHASAEELKDVYLEYSRWHDNAFPNVKILDVALHMDEATPHIHERHVWTATSEKYGTLEVNQEAALREMGIQPPNPDKPVSRYNNAKMTYTAQCRAKFQEISLEHGIELITEPKPRKKTKKLEDWQVEMEQVAVQNAAEASQKLQEATETLYEAKIYVETLKKALQPLVGLYNTICAHIREDLLRVDEILKEKDIGITTAAKIKNVVRAGLKNRQKDADELKQAIEAAAELIRQEEPDYEPTGERGEPMIEEEEERGL